MILPFGQWQPDISDYESQDSKNITGVLPRGDGYGPFQSHLAVSAAALPAACRGMFYARKNDGSVSVFVGTSNKLFVLNNTTLTWTPVTRVTQVTSISNATPAVITLVNHGLSIGDPVQFTTTGGLPTGLSVGTVYYVITAGFTSSAFEVSATPGGTAINTSSAGSGDHSATLTYSALDTSANWQFVQFNKYVIAVQRNVPPQVLDLTGTAIFADLAGSPPQAAYVSIVNRFIVLSGIASPNVYRIQWSGLNATTTWTSGLLQSDFQDFGDGGFVRGVAGGEFGVIFQDTSIRRMTYAPGSPYIFGIDRISLDDGLFAPYSLVTSSDRIFYLSMQGFKRLDPGGYPVPIGKERIDHTFFSDADLSSPQLIIGSSDPTHARVFWAYKSKAGTSGLFDKVLCYDWQLDRWTIIPFNGEYLASLSQPGLTLENLDTVFGTNIDTIALSSLDAITPSAITQFGGVDSSHKYGFFSGPNIEATLETGQHGADGKRIFVRGFRPITDAPVIYGSGSKREREFDPVTYTSEAQVNALGICDLRYSTRYSRGRVRIPAGTTWTFATGIEPDVVAEGSQ